MNRLLQWLAPSAAHDNTFEQKSAGSALVAIHAATNPVWSAMEASGSNARCFNNPIVYRCVRMISEAAASVPWLAVEGQVEMDGHPLVDLLVSPNPFTAGSQFMESVYGHLLLSGNAYLVNVTIGDEVKELHFLDPDRVVAISDDNGWPCEYEYSYGSTRTHYCANADNRQILHLNLFNPIDAKCGMSPLGAAHMAVDIHNAASAWNKALLDNSARPSGALVYASSGGENLSQDQLDRLKTELEQGYSGASRAGRPMLLEGGLDWKAMGYSPRDMDFLEAKNGAAREIALAFGVPPMLLGIPGDNTYSNYVEANRAFWRQTVLPLVEKTSQGLSNWLGDFYSGNPCLKPDLENVEALGSDRQARWARIESATFLTVNEKREALGYAALGDGHDEL